MVNLEKNIIPVDVPLWSYDSVKHIVSYEAISIEAFGAIDYSVWDY